MRSLATKKPRAQDRQLSAETLLVGYGTLLYRDSLGHSIGATPAESKLIVPVVVRDYKRLFNLRPEHYQSSHKLNAAGNELGAMNVEPSTGSSFNAVAIPVNLLELEILDRRERYYQRVTAPVHDFSTGGLVGLGHFYAAALGSHWLDREVRRLLPRWQDIVWARTGAYAISLAFGQYYDATTYLADGETLMIDFYRQHLPNAEELALP
jgi:hypothetical protein